MCGIVGVTGNKNSVSILINGLKKLEYRGYDSAGIYVNDQQGHDYLVKRPGRISNLEEALTPELDTHGGQRTENQMRLMRIHNTPTITVST